MHSMRGGDNFLRVRGLNIFTSGHAYFMTFCEHVYMQDAQLSATFNNHNSIMLSKYQ